MLFFSNVQFFHPSERKEGVHALIEFAGAEVVRDKIDNFEISSLNIQ